MSVEGSEQSDRRAEIIKVAARVFLEKGYAGASMTALSSAAGIQKASFYHHFKSKEDLFAACVTEGYDVAIHKLQAIRDDPDLSDIERLEQAVDEIYRITIGSDVGRMSPLIAEVSSRIPMVAKRFYRDFIRPQHDLLNEIIAKGVRSGVFVNDEPLGVEQLVFGPVVTLSLSREMLASIEVVDEVFPVGTIRESHKRLLIRLLTGGRSAD